MSGLYLDSSALTKLVIDEAESAALTAVTLGNRWFSSRVAVVEVTKAVRRRDRDADPAAILAKVSWVELDEGIAAVASSMGGPILRALDAIHVASALRVASEVGTFVTYDARQAGVARAAGIPVMSPKHVPGPDDSERLEADLGVVPEAPAGSEDDPPA